MTLSQHTLYLIILSIPLFGLCAQWLAWRFHLPAIVLLSATGLMLGPGLSFFQPDIQHNELLQIFIKLSVAIILFEGGLYLHLFELKEVFGGVRRLIFPAIPIAWGIYGLFTYYIGQISMPIAFIFGAIIVVSGPTVVIPLLRQARLKKKSASYIKWEGIINDPIGALLAVLVFQFVLSSHVGDLSYKIFWHLFLGVLLALVLGVGSAFILGYIFRRGHVPEFLKPPLVIVAVLLIYHISNLAQEEAGLFAVTALGIVLSNLKLPSISEIRRFTESIGIILISCLFIILTASLQLKQLTLLDWHIGLLMLSIMFVARPIVVMLSTIGSQVSWPDRILLSWIAPRGVVAAAVAGVFAYELEREGVIDAHLLVPLVFVLILSTVVAHGFSLPFVAKRLRLAATKNNGVLIVGASLWSIELAKTLVAENIPVIIADTSWHKLKHARLEGLNVYYGQVLSEEAEERLDLSEIGYVLALSDNDAFNALVCARFAHELGRNRVFQLPIIDGQGKEARDLHPTLVGTPLFEPGNTYESLLKNYFLNWQFSTKSFTQSYTYDDFKQSLMDQYIRVVLITQDNALAFNAGQKLSPKEGDRYIIYHKKSEK